MIRNLRWFLAGMLCTAAIGYAAAVTILNDVLNAVQTYSIEDNKFWFAYDTSIWTDFGCFYFDPTRTSERPRLGRTSLANYITMLRLKIGVTGKIESLTKDQQVFCNYLITGTGWTDPSLVAPVVQPVVTPPLVITAPTGTLTSTEGVWTFGTATSTGGNSILLNGVATGGFGKTLQLIAGKVYTFTLESLWYQWNGKWIAVSTPASSS